MFVQAANVSSFPGDDPFPWWVAVRVDLQFATGLVFAPIKLLNYFSIVTKLDLFSSAVSMYPIL